MMEPTLKSLTSDSKTETLFISSGVLFCLFRWPLITSNSLLKEDYARHSKSYSLSLVRKSTSPSLVCNTIFNTFFKLFYNPITRTLIGKQIQILPTGAMLNIPHLSVEARACVLLYDITTPRTLPLCAARIASPTDEWAASGISSPSSCWLSAPEATAVRCGDALCPAAEDEMMRNGRTSAERGAEGAETEVGFHRGARL